jgi:G:T/U-mismatch repair DNA glycosylase
VASDLLKPDLELVFCGYNPSLTSGRSGYHYAHPGNRFWRVLFAAGITDVVVPSPSGLNRMLFDELVEHYRALAPILA